MNSARQLLTRIGIHSDEARTVALLLGLNFLIGVALVLVDAVGFALFISVNGAQMLPYAYLSIAAGASLVAFVYLRLSARLRFPTLLAGTLIVLVVVTLVLRVGLSMPGIVTTVAIFALPLWYHVVSNLSGLTFWGLAGSLFTIQQKKRLFGLLGAGEWVATIAGGFLADPLIRQFGMSNLLIVAAGSLLCAVPLMRTILRTCPSPKTTQTETGRRAQTGSLLRSRHVILIFAFTAVWWLGYNVMQSIFSEQAAQQFPDAEQLGVFLAQFASYSGILGLVMTMLFTAPILKRYGLWGGLLITPVAVTGLVALLTAGSALSAPLAILFGVSTFAWFLHNGLGFGLDQPARILLFTPLPDAQSERAQVAGEGIVQPLAVGGAGLILLFLEALSSASGANGTTWMMFLFVAIGAMWITVTVLLVRSYRQAVGTALVKRQLGNSPRALPERTSIDLLNRSLNDPYPGAVLYALQTLDQLEQSPAPATLSALIAHPAVEVRCEAYAKIEKLAVRACLGDVKARLKVEQSPEVRAAGWRALAAISDNAIDDLAPLLDSPEPADRCGALVGLLRYGGIDGVLLAGQTFNALLNSSNANDRQLAANVLGAAGVSNFYQPIAHLLQDGVTDVRKSALQAAGQIRHPQLWPLVICACDDSDTRRQAITALAQGGEPVLPAIEHALSRTDVSAATRIALIQAMGRIGGDSAIRLLLGELTREPQQLNQTSAECRAQTITALVRCRFHAAGVEQQQFVRKEIQRELAQAALTAARLTDLQRDWAHANRHDEGQRALPGAQSLLIDALEIELRHARNRTLELLSFLYDAPALLKARYALMALDDGAQDAAQRAHAIELIDTRLPANDKANVLALIEPLPAEQRLMQLGKSFPQTRQSAAQRAQTLADVPAGDGVHAWTRLCAQNVIHTNAIPIRKEGNLMLSIVERVIILKTVNVFARTPADILAELAELLEETSVDAGMVIFNKGEPGDSLYLIVSGTVQVRDGGLVLHQMGEREVFGEMALLDNEPRSATIVATEPTHLLRLEQQSFYDLLMDRPEIATGIIRVLTGYIRNLNQRLATKS